MSDWLAFLGLCVTAAASTTAAMLAYVTAKRANVIHRLVNSQHSLLLAERVVLLRQIARLTGRPEDELKAESAAEHALLEGRGKS